MIATLLLLIAMATATAASAAAPGGWAPSAPPLTLAAGLDATADHLEGALAAGKLTFTGHVEITSGAERLRAARVDLTLEQPRHTVRRVVAKGAVQIIYGPYTATAEVSDFDAPSGRSTLTGGAKIWGVGREVAGERIDIDTTRRTVAVAGGYLLMPAAAGRPAVRVQATTIDADDLRGVAHLKGKVEVVSGARHLWGDEITIHTDPQSGTVRRIDATGGVRVVDGDRHGEAEEAHYDLLRHGLTLSGKAHLVEGGNEIRGARIHLDLATRQVRVERGTIRYRPR